MAQAARKEAVPRLPARDDEPEVCPNCGAARWELQLLDWRRCPGCGARWRNGQQGLEFPPPGGRP